MAEQDFDLTEEATPHKLAEARKKGTVAKSVDFNAVAVLSALVVMLYATGWQGYRQVVKLQLAILGHAGSRAWDIDGVNSWLGQVLVATLSMLAPLFFALVIAAILVNLLQVGPVFSMHPVTPDFDRINPATGFKRLFSMRTLFEAAKSVLKLVILTSVTYFAIEAILPGLASVSQLDPKGYSPVLLNLSASILGKLVLTMLILAILDLTYTRYEFAKKMRMSRRDIKDEIKHREGDPRIRSRIRELRKEMLKRAQATGKVASADVLIVNPTRLAVALCYQEGSSSAPQVVAKGAGELAKKMREMAARHRIPVVQNRSLARTLFREVDFDGYVPEKLYPQLARIMVWVYTLRRTAQARGMSVGQPKPVRVQQDTSRVDARQRLLDRAITHGDGSRGRAL